MWDLVYSWIESSWRLYLDDSLDEFDTTYSDARSGVVPSVENIGFDGSHHVPYWDITWIVDTVQEKSMVRMSHKEHSKEQGYDFKRSSLRLESPTLAASVYMKRRTGDHAWGGHVHVTKHQGVDARCGLYHALQAFHVLSR